MQDITALSLTKLSGVCVNTLLYEKIFSKKKTALSSWKKRSKKASSSKRSASKVVNFRKKKSTKNL